MPERNKPYCWQENGQWQIAHLVTVGFEWVPRLRHSNLLPPTIEYLLHDRKTGEFFWRSMDSVKPYPMEPIPQP